MNCGGNKMKTKTKIGTILAAGIFAAGMIWSWKYDEEINARTAELAKNDVVRQSYKSAQGNDVRLSKSSDGSVHLYVGKPAGPYLIASDENGNGNIEKYFLNNTTKNCLGKESSVFSFFSSPFPDHEKNLLMTALGKSTVCESEIDLLRFANTDNLSRIERELLPYYGQKTR